MKPRPYQSEAIEALDAYLAGSDLNPCIVLPTGAGKTPTMAWAIQRYVSQWPATRVIVLAHIKELLAQGVQKMLAIWPGAPVGVYSAGLGSKDMGYSITYAGIQSVYKKACDFPPFDLIFIDEAHRIPLGQDGQYRQFIKEAKLCNPHLRVVGWTATPYRLGGGDICHKDYILNEVIYTANVKHLIDDGYLSPLRSKIGTHAVGVDGVKKSSGDFNVKQLDARANTDELCGAIVAEAVAILAKENRRSSLWFCVTKEHAERVSKCLAAHGVTAPVVHDGTPAGQRDAYTRDFAAGRLRALCNINVLSEGFDAPCVDAVVMIRPTASKGLYYQQVGRGLRLNAGKSDCLILDFAGNVARHGPIDVLEGQKPRMRTCPTCAEHFPEPLGACPSCGWVIPPGEAPDVEPGERAARLIPTDPKARTEAAVLSSGAPWEMLVEEVTATVHPGRNGKPATLCVVYYGPQPGFESHREWVCLAHDGFAGHKARSWWRSRFGDVEPVPSSAEQAVTSHLFLGAEIAARTESITVRQNGKYTEVIGAKFRKQQSAAIAG